MKLGTKLHLCCPQTASAEVNGKTTGLNGILWKFGTVLPGEIFLSGMVPGKLAIIVLLVGKRMGLGIAY